MHLSQENTQFFINIFFIFSSIRFKFSLDKHTIVEIKVKGKYKILGKDRTKTKASHRTLPLTDKIIIVLETAKKQQKYYKRKFKKNYNTKY